MHNYNPGNCTTLATFTIYYKKKLDHDIHTCSQLIPKNTYIYNCVNISVRINVKHFEL